ncbi:HDOD domain-containing protein [Desulfonatronovibrio hydrogenovorans]|uniref:HDOD domain-containing protein n=1 Tax=Desulfonatronovibrio hydrogenovorans TaxID=53245 RepID=UPI00068AA0F2|nr:HDOD domain-containing protein [Desulfonatronovibrio hydrogenovorans]
MEHEKAQFFLRKLSGIKNDLPVSAQFLGDLFRQTSPDSISSLDEIARTISRDQGLTAKVLSRANSAYYGFQAQISSISRAANLLGFFEVRKIILAVSLSDLGAKVDKTVFNLSRYWEHQCFVASLAEEIGIMCGRNDSADLFTMGILHDLGKLMVVLYASKDWLEIVKLAHMEDISLNQAEDKFWGMDHALIGAMVLRQWNFPESITEVVNWHHNPDMCDPKYLQQAEIINLADFISRNLEENTFSRVTRSFSKLGLDMDKTLSTAKTMLTGPELMELKSLFSN